MALRHADSGLHPTSYRPSRLGSLAVVRGARCQGLGKRIFVVSKMWAGSGLRLNIHIGFGYQTGEELFGTGKILFYTVNIDIS